MVGVGTSKEPVGITILSEFSTKILNTTTQLKGLYCKDDRDASLSSSYVNMIGLLAKFVRASNSLKIIIRYLGQV